MPWWMWLLAGFWVGYVLAAVLMYLDIHHPLMRDYVDLTIGKEER